MKISRRDFLEYTTTIALTMGSGVAFFGGSTSSANAQDLSTLMEPGTLGEMWLGDENAPVTVIEYASMTCPHCKSFHENILPALKEKYIDTGKVRMIFREFPFDPRAAAAFMLARCAPKEQYFPMIDILFKQQSIWSRAEDPVPPLLNIAKLAGFTEESFNACLRNQKILDGVMEVQKRAQDDYGVNSTPSFFINGSKYTGNYTVEDLSKAFDSEL